MARLRDSVPAADVGPMVEGAGGRQRPRGRSSLRAPTARPLPGPRASSRAATPPPTTRRGGPRPWSVATVHPRGSAATPSAGPRSRPHRRRAPPPGRFVAPPGHTTGRVTQNTRATPVSSPGGGESSAPQGAPFQESLTPSQAPNPIRVCRHCGGEIREEGGHRHGMNPNGVTLKDVWTSFQSAIGSSNRRIDVPMPSRQRFWIG